MIEQKKPHMGFLADESRLYICVVSNFRMCAPMYVTCDRYRHRYRHRHRYRYRTGGVAVTERL